MEIGTEQLLLHFDNMCIIHLWTIEKVEKQTNQAVYTSAVPAAKSWCTGLMSQVFISLEQIESTSIG